MLNISYDGVVSLISNVLPGMSKPEASDEQDGDADWDALLNELRSAIDGFDSDAAQAVMDKAAQATHDGKPCAEILKKVFDALLEYDFMAASEALDEIGGEV